MSRDSRFWLRVGVGLVCLIIACGVLAATPRGYFLDIPSNLLAAISIIVLLSAFISAIRRPRP